MFWTLPSPTPQPPAETKPSLDLPIVPLYRLTADGVALWRSTEDTDKYYRHMFCRCAVAEMSKKLSKGQVFHLVDDKDQMLVELRAVRVDTGGPP